MRKLKLLQQYQQEITFVFMFIIVFMLVPKISFTYFHKKVKASYQGLDKVRGAPLILYQYTVDGKKYEGSFEKSNISTKRLEMFQNGDSINIRYVKFLPFFSRYERDDN